MGGKNAPKVYDFLMSIHYGLCHGPLDNLNKVWIKDKSILCGNYAERTDIPVQQPELFGGDDGEGGAVGVVEYYPGTDDQVASEGLAARFGRTPDNMPGYRGLASLFFRGFGSEGFRWSSNNPYLPGLKASVSRFPTTLGLTNSRIYPVQDVVEQLVDDAQPGLGSTFVPQSSQDGFEGILEGPLVSLTLASGITEGTNGDYAAIPENIRDWHNLDTDSTGMEFRDNEGQKAPRDASGYTLVRWFNLDDLGLIPEQVQLGTAKIGATLTCTDGFDVLSGTFDIISVRLGTTRDLDGQPHPDDIASGRHRPNIPLAEIGPGSFGSGERTESFEFSLTSDSRWLRFEIRANDNEGFILSDITVTANDATPAFCDPDDEGLRLLPNANPAHIIHEVMVNPEWGKGEDPTRLDAVSLTAAAQTFRDEFFGLSFAWVRQGSIEEFIQQVLDHTQSMFFIHPRTGLWTLKPLRGDYDAAAVLAGRRLTPSNSKATKRKRRAWGETINEIIVKYTDPQTEEEATVVSHNLANIAIQGGVISETRNYPGVRDEWLAQTLADRDVTEAGHPLYSAEVECDRSFWDVVPGDVLPLSWPEDGVEDMIVRVMKVNYGSPTARTIKLSVVEDVFALEKTAYGPVQKSEWASTRAVPEPLDAQMAMAGPLPLLIRDGFDLAEIDANYPATGIMLLGSDDDNQAIDIAVNSEVTRTDGSTTTDTITNVPPVRSLLLAADLVEEASSLVSGSFITTLTLSSAEQGDLLLIGDSEANQEIVMLGPFNAMANTWTLWRGIYDTVPSAWAAGTRVWVLPDFAGQSDPSERAGGEMVRYWFLPRMSEGRLTLPEAAEIAYTASERPHLPFRPANVQIDGNGFALADYADAPVNYPIPVTWANRNRTVEDQVALKWTQGNVTPETGQTTVVRVFDATGSLAGEVTGLAGVSHDMTAGDFFGVTYGYLEFVSERDGLRSRPGARRWFDMRQGGYGSQYGVSYG